MNNQWLKDAIIEYVSRKTRVSSIDIALHFQIVEQTIKALNELCAEEKLKRTNMCLNGFNEQHYYSLGE